MPGDFGARIAARALGLVGVPFRLHGRSPETGLDCVGLVADVLQSVGFDLPIPVGYELRGQFEDEADHFFNTARFEALKCHEVGALGDCCTVRIAPRQLHFIIIVSGGFVHAHAGLRRVVLTPGPVAWPVIGRWCYIGG